MNNRRISYAVVVPVHFLHIQLLVLHFTQIFVYMRSLTVIQAVNALPEFPQVQLHKLVNSPKVFRLFKIYLMLHPSPRLRSASRLLLYVTLVISNTSVSSYTTQTATRHRRK